MRRLLAAMFLVLLSANVSAGSPVRVDGVRLWQSAEKLRLVFDISSPLKQRVFRLSNPDRVVIDLENARMGALHSAVRSSNGWLKRIRTAVRNRRDLRLVLDLGRPVTPSSFILGPNSKYGHRLVVDLVAKARAPSGKPHTAEPNAAPPRGRDIVIAIDAGHGGEDPGAIGRHNTREKDVVLAIARKLRDMVNKEPGMRAVMIRDGDYYIGLRERIRKARKHKADLFVSIHADSFKDHKAAGSSVFTLSSHGASSEAARWLAAKENAADLIGGVSLGDKDDTLASVLLDLSLTATIEASTKVAAKVLSQLGNINKLHKPHVEQAGFAVLKSPDIPSILVETAFISNPGEERKLKSGPHQKKVAGAILAGVRSYFRKNPPPGTTLALRSQGRKYVIKRGDTLSTIARRYRVRMEVLRHNNGLRDDLLKVGDVLLIPGTLGG